MPNGLIHQLRSMLPGNGRHGGRPLGVRDDRRLSAPGRRAETAAPARPGHLSQLLRAFLGLALLFLSLPAPPAGASVQGDLIVNSASFLVDGVPQASTSVSTTVVVRTASTVQFLKYAAPLPDGTLVPGASLVNLATTYYRTGASPSAPFAGLPAPTPLGASTALSLSAPIPLVKADAYHAGEPIFVMVTDPDQNLDRGVRETVLTSIVNGTTGETELLRLTETGPDTGVFAGYIPSLDASGATGSGSYNGVIPVSQSNSLNAHYTDVADGSDSSAASVVVDPLGIVFDSTTGKPVDGATVTLFDMTANRPATVFGDNGVSSFPATVTTGSVPKDSSGRSYAYPPGGFRFPFIVPGTYQLRVTPPAGYQTPSAASNAALAALSAGPFVVTTGSRGETFSVNPGPALRIDIPADPVSGRLWVQKSALKSQVSAGDFLPYQINVQNNDQALAAGAVLVTDRLPLGFRYRKGSTTLNQIAAADPAISADGRTLSFGVGDLAPKASVALQYVVEVSAGASLGFASNTALAESAGVSSNLASAQVEVRSDFLSSRSLVMGRVYNGSCSEDPSVPDQGLAGVRIYLEDGSFVDTDKQGMYHFEGVTPTAHVVQLDLDSLPAGYAAVPCESNSRFAGRAYSQFVELQGGTMWRADFHVARQSTKGNAGEHELRAPAAGADQVQGGARGSDAQRGSAAAAPTSSVNIDLSSSLKDGVLEYQVRGWGGAERLSNKRLKITLPAGVAYLPGSSQLDGAPCAEPRQDGERLSYPLGDSSAEWIRILRFRAEPKHAGTDRDLLTRAQLSFDTPAGAGLATPEADNVLRRVREEGRLAIPDIVLHPHFPSFGAELDAEDRARLDELALLLSVLDVEQISVAGHTDTVRIAPRSRGIHRDNQALSLARASSVGRYLIGKLHLPPSKLELYGFGDSQPVASNRSAEGRTENRRVEIRVQSARLFQKGRVELTKDQSGIQKVAIAPSVAPKLVQKDPPAELKPPKAQPAAEEAKPDPAPGIRDELGVLSPANGSVLIYPVNGVRVCLVASLAPRLTVDGKVVPAERIGFTMKDPATGKALYSYIGVDFGAPGEHTLLIEGLDPFGNPRFSQSVKLTRSGAVSALRVLSFAGNIADGKTPIKLQLELLDGSGHRIPGAADLEIREGELKAYHKEGETVEGKAGEFERVHVDAQGNALFQPLSKSGLYRCVLALNGVKLATETYLKPVLRDWILVGLAEGTAGYNAVSGHLESLQAAGADDKFYDQERVAFYAKGTVKGEWLLTASYDSAKSQGATGNGLFQTIDPNTYYTLYGDASHQQYDAASVKKLYLKIERDQFYARILCKAPLGHTPFWGMLNFARDHSPKEALP